MQAFGHQSLFASLPRGSSWDPPPWVSLLPQHLPRTSQLPAGIPPHPCLCARLLSQRGEARPRAGACARVRGGTATYKTEVCCGTRGTRSSIKCMQRMVLLKQRHRLGQERAGQHHRDRRSRSWERRRGSMSPWPRPQPRPGRETGRRLPPPPQGQSNERSRDRLTGAGPAPRRQGAPPLAPPRAGCQGGGRSREPAALSLFSFSL